MSGLTINVLGALQVTLADGSAARLESDKTRALLVYLAVEASRPHRRDALVGLLWPDEPDQTARHNLRQALFSLRQAIGDLTARPPYFLITRDEIQFNATSDYELDLARFDAHLAFYARHTHTPRGACPVCAPHLQQAADLYRGRFLQEFFLADSAEFEAWALALRESAQQRALDALTDLGRYYEQGGQLAAARGCALRQLELDPWREEAHRQMMRVLALEGQRGSAIAQYEKCRRVLVDELGVEPSSETRAVYADILAGKVAPGVGIRKTPVSGELLDRPFLKSHLPVPMTPFLGRDRELADLARLLANPACRCLTLAGPGGIGKTRLALEAAARIQAAFVHGAHFISLASVDAAQHIVPAIAAAIGFVFQSASPADPKTQLFDYLREKEALLLLDNLEQLLDAPGIEFLAELLAQAPQVKLLLTSREPTRLEGEWVFEVQGLPVPESDSAEGGAQATSVDLFLQAARRAQAGFGPAPEDYRAIVRICRLVDGMPLAIELAAAWVPTLACDEIAQEIGRGLDILSQSTREHSARHRSMRAVFDHSWRLLSEDEQKVLRRLAVFQGGFRREAAEIVAEASLGTLANLVAKSLVRRSGTRRYDLHELIRQFAGEQLAGRPDEKAATRARHGRHYLTVFGQAGGRLRSAGQQEALAELTGEMGNFRAAWDWAVAQAEFGLIDPVLLAVAILYDIRGWLQEGLDNLGRALDAFEAAHALRPPKRAEQVVLGHILASRAVLASRLGQFGQAQAMLERSLAILRPLNEGRLLVESVTFLAVVMELTGNYAGAAALYAEGFDTATTIGERWFAALCRMGLAGLLGITQRTVTPDNTHERLQGVVADWRAIGDPRFIAIGLNNLSLSAARLARYDEARAALEESAALSIAIGDRWGLGFAYRGLGLVAQEQGEHAAAVVVFRKSLATLSELGARQDVARVLAEMSRSVLALGGDAEAAAGWCESLRSALATQGGFIALEALAGIATLEAKRGNPDRGLELVLFVLNHPMTMQDTRDRAQRLRSELEGRLTSQEIQAVQTRAQMQSFERLVGQVEAELCAIKGQSVVTLPSEINDSGR